MASDALSDLKKPYRSLEPEKNRFCGTSNSVMMELIHGGPKKESFVRYYKRNFGRLEGPWPPIINSMLELMKRLEAEVQGKPLYGSTGHTTVVFQRPDLEEGFVCWLTYGLTFVNGEGGCGNVPAYFIQDFSRTLHRAETVDTALEIIAMLVQQCEDRHIKTN